MIRHFQRFSFQHFSFYSLGWDKWQGSLGIFSVILKIVGSGEKPGRPDIQATDLSAQASRLSDPGETLQPRFQQ